MLEKLELEPGSQTREFRMVRADGIPVWVTNTMKSVRRADGEIVLYGSIKEIDKEHMANVRLKSLMDSVPAGIISYRFDYDTSELTVEYFNDELCRVSGYDRDEYRSKVADKPFGIAFQEDVPVIREKIEEILNGERTIVECDCRCRVKTGTIWIRMIARLIEKDEHTASIYVVLVDTTNLKQAQESLAHRTYCLETVDRAISAGTIVNSLGLHGSLLYVSKNIENLIGYSTQEFTRMYADQYKEIIHPDDYERVAALNNRYAMERPKQYEMEFRFIRKDKSVIWVMEKASFMESFDGQPAYISIFVDISQQKRLAEELRINDEERRDLNIMLSATRFVFPLCIYANLSLNSYYMIEYDQFTTKKAASSGVYDELIAVGASTIPDSEHRKVFIETFSRSNVIAAYRAGEKSVSLTHSQTGDDGVVHWNRTVLMFDNDSIDHDIIAIAIAECVDAQKAVEGKLTAALEQAQRVSRVKSDLPTHVSRDFRAPLNAIINLVDLARSDVSKDDSAFDDLEKIGAAGQSMLRRINDIIDMLRIESGSITLRPSLYQHADFVGYIEEAIYPLCASKGIRFTFETKECNVALWVDKARLNQIFFSVLSNTVQYMPAGGSVTFKEVGFCIKHRMLLCDFEVSDTGCDISEDADAIASTELGLAITKHLVELMNGSLRIKREKSVGTNVFIRVCRQICSFSVASRARLCYNGRAAQSPICL